jgi:hypothetical protein
MNNDCSIQFLGTAAGEKRFWIEFLWYLSLFIFLVYSYILFGVMFINICACALIRSVRAREREAAEKKRVNIIVQLLLLSRVCLFFSSTLNLLARQMNNEVDSQTCLRQHACVWIDDVIRAPSDRIVLRRVGFKPLVFRLERGEINLKQVSLQWHVSAQQGRKIVADDSVKGLPRKNYL